MRAIVQSILVASGMLSCGSPSTEVLTVGGALFVGKTLDELGTRIDASVSQAVANSGYLVEKSGRQLDMLLANAAIILREERQRTMAQLSEENQRLINSLSQAVAQLERLQNTALALEDFAVLDIQNLVNQIPLLEDNYQIRRIDGYSQIFRREGVYTFRITGNAFGPGYAARVSVGNHEVSTHRMRTPVSHTLEFDVPATELNGRFSDNVVKRVPLSLRASVAGDDEALITYSDAIVLLPREPAQYSFFEHTETIEPIGDTFDSQEGHSSIGKTGKEFHWMPGSVSTSCPIDSVIVGEPVTRARPGTHMEWLGCTKSDNDHAITCDAKHKIHDQDTHLYVKVRCKRHQAIRKELTKLCVDIMTQQQMLGLRYGQTCGIQLEEKSTFDLNVKFFNGERFSLTASALSSSAVTGRLEGQGLQRRLLVQLVEPKR